MAFTSHVLVLLVGALLASLVGRVNHITSAFNDTLPWLTTAVPTCDAHAYTTEIISLDPLLIYITNLIAPSERAAIIVAGEPLLTASPLTGPSAAHSQARTSRSAPLPADNPAVACVLARSRAFLGSVLAAGRDDMGAPQMVRYAPGQKFDLHTDWFARPRVLDGDAESGRRRMYNRAVTLFAVLACEECTEGETWFPEIVPRAAVDSDGRGVAEGKSWRLHENGGVAFRPVPGNALFWVNLLPNGTGDTRLVHAGLPTGTGVKTAMNIWPRTFFGPDAWEGDGSVV